MTIKKQLGSLNIALTALLVATLALTPRAAAQDQDESDPPGRVARLGYMQGSVSFQPAGESEWVEAVSNRPMTIGDRLWADMDSRAELQLGSAVVRLDANTDFSFLNLDDRTTQIQLAAGALSISVRQLDRDEVFEVDTPNQAFWVTQPGRYRVEASEDGNYTVVSVREGEGESTGNGQNYALHAGQRWTFSGMDPLTADVAQIGGPDEFDNWAYARERRYDDSRSAQYVSRDVVGYDDLDDYGEWRDDREYGHVWFPTRVDAGWAPYRTGHWDWIAPWGWTWVDDAPWGYAPFHYGRWVSVGRRWGWVPGPLAVRPVYAPALVVFLGSGGGFGGNVGWFPLGPREVYVPSYRVSRGYVNRVNVSNTTVNTTTITNVYNTTIVNKTTNITNVTYVNRNVQGAVTAVPQRTFVSAQPVASSAVAVSSQKVAAAPVSARVAVVPTRESVLGARANTVNRAPAPPPAVRKRQVVARTAPPPPVVPFATQQQALAQHPGEAPTRREVQNMRPATVVEAHPSIKIAPPGKPATPNAGRPGSQSIPPRSQPDAAEANQPANAAAADKPSASKPDKPNASSGEQPANRPRNRAVPDKRPDTTNPVQPNRPPSTRPERPESTQPDNRPEPRRPEPNRSEPGNPTETPELDDRPAATQQDNRPEPKQPPSNRPENRAERNRPAEPPVRSDRSASEQQNPVPNDKPESIRDERAPQVQTQKQGERNSSPPAGTNASRPPQLKKKPQTPAEKKREQQRQKKERKDQEQEEQRTPTKEEAQKPPEQSK